MDVHKKKITEPLGSNRKQEILGKYLTLKNKLGLNFFKPEYDGVKHEKEDTILII